MANVDESTSLSSDEKLDFECTPCKDEDVVKSATYFCPDCVEYYCNSCEISHRRLKATKTHKVLHGDELYTSASQKRNVLPVMYCSCSQSSRVQYCCNEHSEVFCLECKNINHRKCTNFSIEEKSNSFNKVSMHATIERVKANKSELANLQDKQKATISDFSKTIGECKEDIETVRKQLHAFVDEITDVSLMELEASDSTHSSALNILLTTARGITQRLTHDEKLLHDAVLTGETSQMFVADTVVSKDCDNYEKLIADVKNDMIDVAVLFQKDSTITGLSANVKKLGSVSVQTKRSFIACMVPKTLLSMAAVEDKQCSTSPSGARRITGSTFMSNGDLLICDFTAKNIKLFEPSFNKGIDLQLPDHPWDVFSVSATSAIVSMPLAMKLQFVETRPSLKEKTAITLERKCFGIAVADEKIIVSCSDDPGRGEIRILDISRKLKKQLGPYQADTTVLSNPTYIVHVVDYDNVYASEYNKGEIYCLTKGGNVQFKYNIAGASLRGLIVDEEGNVYVCDENKNCIYVVTEGGTKHQTFLTLPSTADKPTSVSYRASDDTLVVTCHKKVLVYRLKQK